MMPGAASWRVTPWWFPVTIALHSDAEPVAVTPSTRLNAWFVQTKPSVRFIGFRNAVNPPSTSRTCECGSQVDLHSHRLPSVPRLGTLRTMPRGESFFPTSGHCRLVLLPPFGGPSAPADGRPLRSSHPRHQRSLRSFLRSPIPER